MKIVLFVNDSYFAYLLTKEVIWEYRKQIVRVVFSLKIKHSPKRILNIFSRSDFHYFIYRSSVAVISMIRGLLGTGTVGSLVKQAKIPSITSSDINKDMARIFGQEHYDLGIAINFDQIIGKKIIDLFRIAIINVHAAKLPRDKGISPLLWAFGRGDKEIWTTIYKIDSGIDSGPVYKQFKIDLSFDDTAFSAYEKTAIEGGQQLSATLKEIISFGVVPKPQIKDNNVSYWSWPNKELYRMMTKNNRSYIGLKDIFRVFYNKNV